MIILGILAVLLDGILTLAEFGLRRISHLVARLFLESKAIQHLKNSAQAVLLNFTPVFGVRIRIYGKLESFAGWRRD